MFVTRVARSRSSTRAGRCGAGPGPVDERPRPGAAHRPKTGPTPARSACRSQFVFGRQLQQHDFAARCRSHHQCWLCDVRATDASSGVGGDVTSLRFVQLPHLRAVSLSLCIIQRDPRRRARRRSLQRPPELCVYRRISAAVKLTVNERVEALINRH